ncbi:hypothetical protein V8E55_006717 [Tylopilus felleus]
MSLPVATSCSSSRKASFHLLSMLTLVFIACIDFPSLLSGLRCCIHHMNITMRIKDTYHTDSQWVDGFDIACIPASGGQRMHIEGRLPAGKGIEVGNTGGTAISRLKFQLEPGSELKIEPGWELEWEPDSELNPEHDWELNWEPGWQLDPEGG